MEQHQQGTQAPGMAAQLQAGGGGPEHFHTPLSPILGLEDSFDNGSSQVLEEPGSANAAAITKQAAVITSQLIQSPEDAATSKVAAADAALGGDAVAHPALVKTGPAEKEVPTDNEGDNRHTLQQCSPHR
jgi:hypothetical protein